MTDYEWFDVPVRFACLALALLSVNALCEGLPEIPVGLDAYKRWDLWPQQRIGMRAYMRGTYDRTGGNEGADASHFLYQLRDDFNVTLDVAGPGVLCFVRYNHWHGSPWHYVVDGYDNVIAESSTVTPTQPVANSVFLPEKALPNPLTWTWSQTQGADLSWVPIPFEKGFQMAYGRTHYGTGYYIYHQFVPGSPLSRPIRSWRTNAAPERAVIDLLTRAGSDLAPREAKSVSGKYQIGASQIASLTISDAPAVIRAIEVSFPAEKAIQFSNARLKMFWDERTEASVDAPLALFFGAGTFYNRDNRRYLVKAFPVNVRFEEGRVFLACYFPMPFFQSARIELSAPDVAEATEVRCRIRWTHSKEPAKFQSYFHATYRDFPQPERGRDLVLLDTKQTEGGGVWSGHFIGTSFIFSERATLNTLEGDPRFFFDDSDTPQGQGTGTEEWGGGGDYWGGQNMTLALAGHPAGARNEKEAKCAEDKIESAYRFLLADLMPFGRNARIQLEHGGEDQSTEHYQTVTYWYGLPAASLLKTDELKIGDVRSESAHTYVSPEASEPYEMRSRYELGVDHAAGKEIYPEQTDVGRTTKGASEFTLKIDPRNAGVMLRRKLDYQYPNQRADVFVADVTSKAIKWRAAGTWYLAGGNTCVYSNPKGELGATEHRKETSNRWFRDDEFLLPRNLTKGRGQIRIRVEFRPVNRPLFPGEPLPDLRWSEIKYTAYSFVAPEFTPRPRASKKYHPS